MSIDLPRQQPPARRLWTSRVIATLGLFVLIATLFCVVVGYTLVREADDRQAGERRSALLGAIDDIRSSGADFTKLDARHVRNIERTAGLKDLRFSSDPGEGREMQSVLDGQGRIIGWFSWQDDPSMTNALQQLKPLLMLSGGILLLFAGVALWQLHRNIVKLSASERTAWTLAHQDILTELPNHRKMIETIDTALASRGKAGVVTLAFLDIDGLQDINDAHGHHVGDELLRAMAKRIGDILPARASCGRFDGDTFALVSRHADVEQGAAAAADFAHALSRPYWVHEQAISVGVTAGLAYAPQDAVERNELIRRADLALRAAKKELRGGAVAFRPAMDAAFFDRRFLERDLRRALQSEELDVHYQPIVSADRSRIVGAEALLRWTHPERGAIPPMQFVPIAEQCGLMGQLGRFVLRRALRDASAWPSLSIAVNLSPVQVRDAALVEEVSQALEETNTPAHRLLLEVTEGVLIDNPDETRARLEALKTLGVRLALDDFGTGYSSLTYLQRFRFDKLKIDRGFVSPLGRDAGSQALVQAIVTLGRALDMTLLAEGVETEAQRVLLRLAGCEELQGYLFGKPAPREALTRMLADKAATQVA